MSKEVKKQIKPITEGAVKGNLKNSPPKPKPNIVPPPQPVMKCKCK
ncbi:hypothetical protein [Leptospira phage LE4]|uniref:Uncharacterized protein n=1 Tax=Leptospira phage LE4 TaxID=2041383 RepID=A0A343LEA9_9CAUD|nr:hypothetical protein HWB34_gp06 [Leptospira phage LE4]ATN95019.1 hypothetical protein [Leptospira phage LE4]